MKILIAVPCFNEERDIDLCISNIKSLNFYEPNLIFDIAVFNDGSTDSTLDILKKIEGIKILNSQINYGLATVFNNIIFYSKNNNYDFLVIFDADNQYPVNEIPKILSHSVQKNIDIALGIRNFKNNKIFSPFKNFIQRLGSLIVSIILGLRVNDATTGFRVYSSKALETLFITNSFSYTIESLFVAKRYKLNIFEYKLINFSKTRDSRLFKSNLQYIIKTVQILSTSIALYKRNVIKYIYFILIMPGIILISRFFSKYILEGSNQGNVQSLTTGLSSIIVATLVYVFLLIISYLKTNLVKIQKSTFVPDYIEY
jgi:glycosyltransferase involved in cell wall biosynthesis